MALLDNGVTQDIYIERRVVRSLVGNIYAGRVVRVLPGVQLAFVDIGAERNGLIMFPTSDAMHALTKVAS